MASTTIITDLQSNVTTGPSAASVTKSIAAAGPITDLPGSFDLLVTKAKELKLLGTQVKAALDAGDGTLTVLQGVLDSLV